jgi:hypothetical protein
VEDEGFVPSKPVKGNAWYIVSGLMELVAAIFHAFFEFFDTLSSIAAHRYVWEKEQRKFFEEASKDIEAIVNATSTEPSWGERTRGSE